MKRLSIIAVPALLGVSLAMAAVAAGPAAPVAPPKHTGPGRVAYEEEGFSFAPPADWAKADPSGPCFMAYYIPAARNGFWVNMNVIATPIHEDDIVHIDEDLPSMREALRERQASVFPGYSVEDEGTTTINGRAAVFFSGSFDSTDRRIQNLQYCIAGSKNVYVVTFTTTAEDFARDRPSFEKIVETIITD